MTGTVRKIRAPRTSDAEKLKKTLEDLIHAIDDHGEKAIANAREMSAKGWKASTGGNDGGQGKGGHSDPTAQAALSGGDRQAILQAQRFYTNFATTWQNAERMITQLKDLTTASDDFTDDTDTRRQKAGSGHCAACGGQVTGIDRHRLIRPKGTLPPLGPTCYERWRYLRDPNTGEVPAIAMLSEDELERIAGGERLCCCEIANCGCRRPSP